VEATRIADSVHGTVELSRSEAAVIGTQAFQRLRGVKHLGLASLVFPGADYSRFAHGLGTLHVTGRIVDRLAQRHPDLVTDADKRLYRMAALLHDVGHYPFSHTFERALNDYYSDTELLQRKPSAGDVQQTSLPAEDVKDSTPLAARWLHEELGRNVILQDTALREILDTEGIDAEELTRVIDRRQPPKYANLVSSDLDADRIDYLMRTAKHTGLPYGNVDLDYLLSQICLDKDHRICFTQKGMRAAEHVLLSRYFDYQQVSYHKTVAGLELVLNDAVGVLLRLGLLACRPADLQAMIDDGRWYGFDDAHVIAAMRKALAELGLEDQERALFAAILDRRPPKLVAERERLGAAAAHRAAFQGLEHSAKSRKQEWESRFGVRFYIWTQKDTRLTKIGASVPASVLEVEADEESYDRLQQSVRILTDDNGSKPIQEYGRSLISALSGQALYSLRVYALLSRDQESLRSEIVSTVDSDLGPVWRLPFD
jgi:HD superfamily phosphohydrolase